MNDTLVRLENVEKIFKTKAGPFTALRGVDLQIQGGRVRRHCGSIGEWKEHPHQHEASTGPPQARCTWRASD